MNEPVRYVLDKRAKNGRIAVKTLTLSPEEVGPVKKTRFEESGLFDKFPRWWTSKMKSTSQVAAFKLALLLLQLNWKSMGHPVIVSNKAAKAAGISRSQKERGMLELEQLGVIRVRRRGEKKSSLVTILLSPP